MSSLLRLLLSATLMALPAAPQLKVRDIDGREWTLPTPRANQLDLLIFLSTECPISNRYAPEIVRICGENAARGVRCFAVYPDTRDPAAVRRHRQEYEFPSTIAAILDPEHRLVQIVGPRVTPEAAIYSSAGRVYRGRIDDLYIDIGRSRRAARQHDVRQVLDAFSSGRFVAPTETEAVGCTIASP